jgi:prevent-host-death family protein
MTASTTEQAVGVRELRDHLSQYLGDVADGATVMVTVRGRGVARLSPVESEPSGGGGLADEPLGVGFPVEQLSQIPVEGSIGSFL